MHSSNNLQNRPQNYAGLILTLVGLLSVAIVVLKPARRVSAQAVTPSWSYTGNLNTGRCYHTATLLQNGKVLVAGGIFAPMGRITNSAELYDPATGTWSVTGNLNTARRSHTATLLPNGKVLVAGGYSNSALNSAELYDPATETWSDPGNLNAIRLGHTATLLPNGKVLVAGGHSTDGRNSAELYDSVTGMWSMTGNPNAALGSTATLLQNGKVLVAGGGSNGTSAELYDPATGTWSITGSLNAAVAFTATLLPDGRVLVAGSVLICGSFVCLEPLDAELYDPTTGIWNNTANPGAYYDHTMTLLPSGEVLLAGGVAFPQGAEFYDPANGEWCSTAIPNTKLVGHTATLLPNGKVLVAGGNTYDATGNTLNTAQLYDPGTSSTSNTIDDAQFFVRQNYLDFLSRQPDADGLAFWTNQITLCGADQQCIEAKRINVSAAFFLSIEFQQTGYLVYRFYKAAYGNLPGAPVPVKFSEFQPDTQNIGQGVIVNQAGWETVLENNKQAFAAEFVQRSRFTSVFPTSLTPDQFVDQLFMNAGVAPSATDRTATINEFGSAATTTADPAARARALRRVAENSILAQQEFNQAFVLMQYFGYLRRNPSDSPEPTLDFQGYNFWLNKLNSFNGNFVNAEMVKAFISSSEYRRRFEP